MNKTEEDYKIILRLIYDFLFLIFFTIIEIYFIINASDLFKNADEIFAFVILTIMILVFINAIRFELKKLKKSK